MLERPDGFSVSIGALAPSVSIEMNARQVMDVGNHVGIILDSGTDYCRRGANV
jgi:hypothetical protein